MLNNTGGHECLLGRSTERSASPFGKGLRLRAATLHHIVAIANNAAGLYSDYYSHHLPQHGVQLPEDAVLIDACRSSAVQDTMAHETDKLGIELVKEVTVDRDHRQPAPHCRCRGLRRNQGRPQTC